jgi:hypothetical protein
MVYACAMKGKNRKERRRKEKRKRKEKRRTKGKKEGRTNSTQAIGRKQIASEQKGVCVCMPLGSGVVYATYVGRSRHDYLALR